MASIPDGDYYILNVKSLNTNYEPRTPMYRLYDASTGYHYYTTDYTDMVSKCESGYVYEATYYFTSKASVPVYKFKANNSSDYIFTTDSTGIGGYTSLGKAFDADTSSYGNIPVYCVRYYYNHVYTIDKHEVDTLVNNYGYTNDGVVFYAAAEVYALDIRWKDLTPGGSLIVYPYCTDISQQWRVSTTPDGARHIHNIRSKLAVDVEGGAPYSGAQNIILYDPHNGGNQSWSIVDQNKSVTFHGKSYPSYSIELFGNPDNKHWCMEVYNSDLLSAYESVDLYSMPSRTDGDGYWIFVPVPTFRTGGTYQLINMYNPSKILSVPVNKDSNNCYLWSTYDNQTQGWVFYPKDPTYTADGSDSSSEWYIRNMYNGHVLDVYGQGDEVTTGQLVDTYPYDGQQSMTWKIESHGETYFRGVLCKIVSLGMKNTSTGTYYWLDSEHYNITNGTRAVVWDELTSNDQHWILYPVDYADSTVPVPSQCYINSKIDRIEPSYRAKYPTKPEMVYPGWLCSDAWIAGANGYEYRYRTRLMYLNGTGYTNWTPWSKIIIPNIVTKDNYSWITEGLKCNWDSSVYKAMDINFQVRCSGKSTSYYSSVYGGWGECHEQIIDIPDITFSKAVLSPKGIRLTYTAVLKHNCHIYITDIKNSDGISILSKEYNVKNRSYSGELFIPQDQITGALTDPITIVYQQGNDACERWTWRTWESTVSFDGISGNYNSKVQHEFANHFAIFYVETLGNESIRVIYNSRMFPCPRYTSGKQIPGYTAFLVPYLFRKKKTKLCIMAYTQDESKWMTYYGNVDNPDINNGVHSWYDANGNTWCLDCRKDNPLQGDYEVEINYTSNLVNGKKTQVLTTNEIKKGHFSAEGAVIYETTKELDTTDKNVDQLLTMVGKHLYYRPPHGEIFKVLVTSVKPKTSKDYAEVTVDMQLEEV